MIVGILFGLLIITFACLAYIYFLRCSRERFQVRGRESKGSYIKKWRSLEDDYGKHMFYIPSAKVIITAFPKGGSSSLLEWLFRVLNIPDTPGSYHEDSNWDGKITRLKDPEKRRKSIKESKHRVLIWRDPAERILSAWKSKLCSDSWNYGTDIEDREQLLPELFKTVRGVDLPKGKTSLGFNEYLELMELIIRHPGGGLNPHFQPFPYEVDFISYTEIWDIKALSDPNTTRNIRRILDTELVPAHRHKSSSVDKRVDKNRLTRINDIISAN